MGLLWCDAFAARDAVLCACDTTEASWGSMTSCTAYATHNCNWGKREEEWKERRKDSRDGENTESISSLHFSSANETSFFK